VSDLKVSAERLGWSPPLSPGASSSSEDLKTLRRLADSLLRYDAVTFLRLLDSLRQHASGEGCFWMFADPATRIFDYAKRRVYQVKGSVLR